MYFEARVHKRKDVKDAADAARYIKSGEIRDFEALRWESPNGVFWCVPDGHIDRPMLEVAVLKEGSGFLEQVESITAGWCDQEKLAMYLKDAEVHNYPMGKRDLIIDEPKENQFAVFTCGCCGEYFRGNVKEQLRFDQDAGYGICDGCAPDWY